MSTTDLILTPGLVDYIIEDIEDAEDCRDRVVAYDPSVNEWADAHIDALIDRALLVLTRPVLSR